MVILVLAAIMGIGLYGLNQKKAAWTKQVQALTQTADKLSQENRSLQASLDYFKDPQNLLKELKSQFNYREAGENLIIIVPASPELQRGEPESSTTASSTAP